MKTLTLLSFLLICLALHIHSKKINKSIKLNEFHREGPFIFLTKMYLGHAQSHMDVSYQYFHLYSEKMDKSPLNRFIATLP